MGIKMNQNESAAQKPKKRSFLKTLKDFFTYNVEGRRKRIWELDLIRGIIMFFVTLDHVCLFAYYWHLIQYKTAFGGMLEKFSVFYLESGFRKFVEPIGLWAICFLSGISCQFSRSSIKRMIKFWIFTAVFMGGYCALHFVVPEILTGTFIFNIVPILTISMTLWYLLDYLKCPMPVLAGCAAFVTGVGLVFFVIFKLNGLFVENPFLAILCYNSNGYIISPNNFEPLFPHLGFFFLGAVLGRFVYKDKKTLLKKSDPPKVLAPIMLLGKHSLKAFLFLPFIIIIIVRLIMAFVWLFI